MKLRLRHTALLLTLTAALLPGCSKSEPEPTPVPEPYYPEQEVVTPQPAPEQPAPEPVDPADPEPVPVEPEPVPTEAPTPVEPELVIPEEESYSLMERLDRAYTYRDPESEENYYIEFKIINNRLFAEVAAQMDTGSRFTYWMAELLPIDAQALLSGDGKPCLLRSREFSGFSLGGAYWGEEEVISLSVTGEQLKYQKGEETYVLTPAETIEEIHDEADLRRYLQLVDEAMMDAQSLTSAGLPGVWESTVNENGSLIYVHLELEENGLFWLMRNALGQPTELYRGAYGVSGEGIHYSAERLGYGSMPYLGVWEYEGSASNGVLSLQDTPDGQIELCTGTKKTVDFYPAGSDIPQDFFPGIVFTYNGKDYDVTKYAPAVNAITDTYTVGKHIVVEGHVGPKNSVYLIFNTETEAFEQELVGTNLIWHSNDINTAVFAFWGDIYTYDGQLIGTIEDQREFYIDELAFSADRAELLVTAGTVEGTEIQVSFIIPE